MGYFELAKELKKAFAVFAQLVTRRRYMYMKVEVLMFSNAAPALPLIAVQRKGEPFDHGLSRNYDFLVLISQLCLPKFLSSSTL